MEEYRDMFPGVITRIGSNKGRKLSEEWKRHISETHWSRKPLEETKHVREALAEIGRQSMKKLNAPGGKAFRMPIGYHTQEFKNELSIRMKSIERTNEWRENTKKAHWINKTQEEVQEILEKIIENGTGFRSKRGNYHSTKMNDDFFFMSSYEERRMKFLDTCDNVCEFTNKHGILIDYEWQNCIHRYNVDLKITFNDGTICLEEIKGTLNVGFERIAAKERACIAFCEERGWKYKMVFEQDLETL